MCDDLDLGGAEVTRCEDEVAAGDHLEHGREVGHRSTVLDDRHGVVAETERGELVLDLTPERLFTRRRPRIRLGLVLGVDGREPDDARPCLAAISTATGLSPPTQPFRVMLPSTSMPGTAARTTAARSEVGT